MKFQTAKRMVLAGFSISIGAAMFGIFFGAGNEQLKSYALTIAIVSLLFTMAVIMKWARCPWCGGSLLRGFFKNKVCPHCKRDLTTGKKKKGHGGRGRK